MFFIVFLSHTNVIDCVASPICDEILRGFENANSNDALMVLSKTISLRVVFKIISLRVVSGIIYSMVKIANAVDDVSG